MRKNKLIAGLISGICFGAFALPGAAFAQGFGGFPTVTPQEVKEANDKKKGDVEEDEEMPGYLVVDKRYKGKGSYTSIQAAINDVAPGGVVVIMPGEYNENLDLTKPVSLQGDRGPGTRVRVAPTNGTKPCLTYQPTRDTDHMMISNIEFTTTEMASRTSVSATSARGGDFSGKTANTRGFPNQPCISVKGGVFTMKESTVTGLVDQFNTNYYGSSAYEFAQNDMSEAYYNTNSVVDSQRFYDGAMIDISAGTAFLEKNIIRGGQEGVRVAQEHSLWDRTLLVDNVITENSLRGLYLAGASGVQATGNFIDSNGIGIAYNGQGDVTIVGNKILNNNSDGVYLGERAKQVLLSLNEIASNQGNGVKIIRANGFIRDDNIFENNGWGGANFYDVNTIDAGYNNLPKIGNSIAVNAKTALQRREERRRR